MKKNFTYYIYCLLVVSTVGLTKLQAQINISVGNTVTENFDGIGVSATVTLPTGWKMSKNNTVRSVDAYSSAVTVTERIAGDNMANNAQNGMYNFGAGDPSSATDRALGGISSGSLSKSVNIYLDLYNNGAGAINDFSISYNVEKYRDGINSAGFSIQMYYSTDGSNWTSAGNDFLTSFAGGDANNNGYASAPGATVSVIGKTLNVSLAASSHLYLAWNYSVASGSTTSNAQALGIDDVIITANSPEEDKPVEVWRGGSFVSDHLTIQAGIGGAQDGDEVRVADGIYEEIVVLNKPNITLKSVNGRDHTIIKCPVTNLDPDNEDNKATLDNLNGIAAQKDMGTITVDGFTVQGFPGGIIQSMGNATGTKFVVINNKVTPYVYNVEEYLRNGIQVTGDNSLVENNEVVVGIYYNDEYGSSGIGVVNANNITVKDNTLTGGYGFDQLVILMPKP
ncbi:MAG: hypothetical protein GX273_04660 [Bacteroidales bacterium]|nr:hypothetical protein [Bacteroidales bacterium]